MKKSSLWVWLLVAVLVVGGVYWYIQRTSATKAAAQAEAFDPVRVTRQDLDDLVSASGTVKLSRVVNVRPEVSGTVKALYVNVGDRVREGQPLLQLDASDLRDRLVQAKEALAAAEARLVKARSDYDLAPSQLRAQVEAAGASLASAEQKLASLKQGLKAEEVDQLKSAVTQAAVNRDNAKADYQRMKDLYAAQAITRQQFEAAEAKYLTAEEAATQAEKKLQASTLPPDPGDVAAAEAQVAQAKANLEVAQQNLATGGSADQVSTARSSLVQAQVAYDKARQDLAAATVKAPVGGIIMDIVFTPSGTKNQAQVTAASPISVGDVVGPESGYISIADPSLVEVHVPVDETDIAKVRVGLTALVTADALESRVFPGKVTAIAPSGQLTDGVVTFDVTVAVQDRHGLLKAGMTTNADLVVTHRPGVLVLPREAVVERRGRAMVQVAKTGERFRRVETGFTDDAHVEILSGLSEGDVVLVPRPAKAPNGNGQNGRPLGLGGIGFSGGGRH